jgi:small-conductance mechanosensitive channel
VEWFGIRLIGVTSTTATKLALTAAAFGILFLIRYLVVGGVRVLSGEPRNDRVMFWTRQASSLALFALLVLVTLSIWFDNAGRLGTVAGFATAGLAIAAQRAVTAFAGYLVIMRGKTFTVGDRIKMGGVRGDVIALGFLQTRILEMGQPPDVNEQEDPGMWVRARQFSGRIATVTNDKVFDEPVFNFSRELPFIWEEMNLPVPYRADRARAEQILLNAAIEATNGFAADFAPYKKTFEAKYSVKLDHSEPRVFWRLTDNWLELTVRFLVPEHGVRDIKDRIARALLRELDAAGIEVASATIEVSGIPPLQITERHAKDTSHGAHGL